MRDLDSPIPWSPLHIQIASDNDVAPLQLGRRIGLTPRVILAGTCCDRSRPRENWPAARARYEAAARRSPALSRPCLSQPCPLYDSTEIVSSRSCSATSWAPRHSRPSSTQRISRRSSRRSRSAHEPVPKRKRIVPHTRAVFASKINVVFKRRVDRSVDCHPSRSKGYRHPGISPRAIGTTLAQHR